MGTGTIVAQKQSKSPKVKGCFNCAYVQMGMYPDVPSQWGCGKTAAWCRLESAPGGSCGPSKANWEPKPPGLWRLMVGKIRRWLEKIENGD